MCNVPDSRVLYRTLKENFALFVCFCTFFISREHAPRFCALSPQRIVQRKISAHNFRLDFHIPAVVFQKFSTEIDTVRHKMFPASGFQPYITVNPCPGVPAAVGRLEVCGYQKFIFSILQKFCNFHLKRGISVFPLTNFFFVYIKGTVHVNTVKAQNYLLPFFLFPGKLLSVPASSVLIQVLCLINQPVMGNSHRLKILFACFHFL